VKTQQGFIVLFKRLRPRSTARVASSAGRLGSSPIRARLSSLMQIVGELELRMTSCSRRRFGSSWSTVADIVKGVQPRVEGT